MSNEKAGEGSLNNLTDRFGVYMGVKKSLLFATLRKRGRIRFVFCCA